MLNTVYFDLMVYLHYSVINTVLNKNLQHYNISYKLIHTAQQTERQVAKPVAAMQYMLP